MSSIAIQNTLVTDLKTDAVVRIPGAGRGFGSSPFPLSGGNLRRLEFVCDSTAPGDICFATIEPGVHQKAKYMIHVVGPRRQSLSNREPQLLRSIYRAVLTLAARSSCRSVGFPLLSVGIFRYPLEGAWRTALRSCCEYFRENPNADLDVVFASANERSLEEGRRQLSALVHETLHGSSEILPGSDTLAPAQRGEVNHI